MLPICHLCYVFLLGFQIKQMRRNNFLGINEGVDHCMSLVDINVVVDFDFLLYLRLKNYFSCQICLIFKNINLETCCTCWVMDGIMFKHYQTNWAWLLNINSTTEVVLNSNSYLKCSGCASNLDVFPEILPIGNGFW